MNPYKTNEVLDFDFENDSDKDPDYNTCKYLLMFIIYSTYIKNVVFELIY